MTAAEDAFFASVPTVYGAAAMIFTDTDGRVLLVKPNYRDHWSLPGGFLEQGELPQDGAMREVLEELGLQVMPGPLLAVGWTAPEGARPRPLVHFVFDGGTLPPGTEITLQEEELDDARFVDQATVDEYLPPLVAARVRAALRARATGGGAGYVSG